jgi:hypothetical protein
MKSAFAALILLAGIGASATLAIAQTEPAPAVGPVGDARSVASDREVGEARRYYRQQCNRHEAAGFCECVTAGVAQELAPAEVRMAARTVGERITAQGDTAGAGNEAAATPEARIAQVESHYADACAQFRS